MSISPDFIAKDISRLFCNSNDTDQLRVETDDILRAINANSRVELGRLFRRIATELRARGSTLTVTDENKFGSDPPTRALLVTINYLDEIGKELESPNSEHDQSFLTLMAFGTSIGVIAGILDYLKFHGLNP